MELTPSPRKAGSWRQAIFQQVKTPSQSNNFKIGRALKAGRRGDNHDPGRTRENYRQLWVKAINQQILLIRMEKENKRLKGLHTSHFSFMFYYVRLETKSCRI